MRVDAVDTWFLRFGERCSIKKCVTALAGSLLIRTGSSMLQITDTVTYWQSRKSARILRVPHGQIFQITDTVTLSTFSTVKSMRRLNPYSDTVCYVSTGLNT